jgi:dethiobiotin synthetase
MTTLFVTASGTDVGKTYVMTVLIAQLRAARYALRALKPVSTGFDAARPELSDSGRLLLAQGLEPTPANIDAVSPYRFAAPLSPDMAAAREQRQIPFDALLDFCAGSRDVDVTLIEGIGGVMVPLDRQHTVLDWIAALGAPALLVGGSYLGSLSHTLTAAGMLRARGCEIAGVIVAESPDQPVPPDQTAAVLARFLEPVSVLVVPRRPAADSDERAVSAAEPSSTPDLLCLLGSLER